MADIDVQTAQLIIQLARDDFYQLGDGAQNGGLLSDLEFALAAQEREFMQRWMDYGDAQFHPGARPRGGDTGDSLRNTGSEGSGGRPSHATSAPVTGPSANADRPPPSSHLRVAVPEPRAHYQSDEEDSDSDLSPILSDTALFSIDVRPAISNNPSRPAISVPSSSNSATRNPVSIHNRSNNGTTRGAPVQCPATPYDDEDVVGPSNSVQMTNALQSVESIPLTRPPLSIASPKLVSRPIVEELSDDEGSPTTGSVVEFETGPSTIVECYFCKEDCPISTTVYTSCHHRLCQTCITRHIEVCIQDETTYPPKCCGNKLQISELHLTDRNLHQRYELKVREYDTPAPSRVYCYRCNRFLDSKSLVTTSYSSNTVLTRATRHCNTCFSWTCTNCKRADHPGQSCQDTAEDRVFRLLTKEKGWQTCPNCKAVVERNGGCNHMTCKCSAQFCYQCATRWKQCAC